MDFPGTPTELTNWSKSERSSCFVIQAHDTQDILHALDQARTQGRAIIPHGAGHSYTDAALNTGGIVLDLSPMRRILAWDPERGVMRVEPGVTLREVAALAWRDGWWPTIAPSTPEVTIGGCVAMNVTGKNAWKCGCFGDHVLAVEMILTTGAQVTLTREHNARLFHAVVGGLGLLGVITGVTLQLRSLASGRVATRLRPAASFTDIFTIFAEEEATSDYLEAWIDGFADGKHQGRGYVSCATIMPDGKRPRFRLRAHDANHRQPSPAARWAGITNQSALLTEARAINRAAYWGTRWLASHGTIQRSLLPYTFYARSALMSYLALAPQGVDTFQAFVSAAQAYEVFAASLSYAQKYGIPPIWCVLKRHRRDPFLLSYQVDGFSLELNFQRTARNTAALEDMLRQMIAVVIHAGGRFYLAKDRYLTSAQYRASLGDAAVEAFLRLKRECDPQTVLQSNAYRRIFQAAPA